MGDTFYSSAGFMILGDEMKKILKGCTTLFLSLATMLSGQAMALDKSDWARFLEQATFGPTPSLIDGWQTSTPEAWLLAQRALPGTRYPALPVFPASKNTGCPPSSSNTVECRRDNYTMYPLQVEFFKNAIYAQDQLRLRMAYTLSQIFVVSGKEIDQPSSMVPFLNLLVDGSLGNFRDLLEKITLNPAMGDYLDMVNNDKPSVDGTIQPNENYAREILQLFSIGLYQLNVDGTVRIGANGLPIPAYDQTAIEGLAHTFTGWTYATLPGAKPKAHNPVNYLQPIEVYRINGIDANHDKGNKHLLSYSGAHNEWVPAGQTAEMDLTQALDNIFYHPNVGPFIGRQLIQYLVTSNPSPDYVSRVAGAFNDNGNGVRGDLYSTLRAVLLDPEARGSNRKNTDYGRLREPALFVPAILRILEGSSDGILTDQATDMGQDIFNAPSVFGHYPRPFQIRGSSLQGPEFEIESSKTTIIRDNFVNTLVYSSIVSKAPGTGTKIEWTRLNPLAANLSTDPLLDYLNQNLLHGTMPPEMKSTISGAISCSVNAKKTACTNSKERAQKALYLVATSALYQIQR